MKKLMNGVAVLIVLFVFIIAFVLIGTIWNCWVPLFLLMCLMMLGASFKDYK